MVIYELASTVSDQLFDPATAADVPPIRPQGAGWYLFTAFMDGEQFAAFGRSRSARVGWHWQRKRPA